MGYTREAAARYSFLLAMPAVFMSGLYKTFKVVTGEDGNRLLRYPVDHRGDHSSRSWWVT